MDSDDLDGWHFTDLTDDGFRPVMVDNSSAWSFTMVAGTGKTRIIIKRSTASFERLVVGMFARRTMRETQLVLEEFQKERDVMNEEGNRK